MDNQPQTLDADVQNQAPKATLEITETVRSSWKEIAAWATFLGIVLFIITFLMLYMISDVLPAAIVLKRIGTLILFLYILLIGVPAWLYSWSAFQIRQGLEREESAILETAFFNMSRLYRFSGIMTIVTFILSLIFSLVLFLKFAGH
jgi:hypothetical protein